MNSSQTDWRLAGKNFDSGSSKMMYVFKNILYNWNVSYLSETMFGVNYYLSSWFLEGYLLLLEKCLLILSRISVNNNSLWCCCMQQNMSLLEDEQKTMVQLGIEDNSQILIEGILFTISYACYYDVLQKNIIWFKGIDAQCIFSLCLYCLQLLPTSLHLSNCYNKCNYNL